MAARSASCATATCCASMPEAGTLTFLGDEREFLSRTPATEDLRAEHHGMGRELFAGFRALVGAADRGASVFG